MSAIEVKGLVKAFGDFTAVDELDLTVRKGEVYGLLGPNGAGKTTTVRMMTGGIVPDSGTATILGMPAGSTKVLSRIGYMPQNLAIYDGMTVDDNLRYFARIQGVTNQEMAERFPLLLNLVQLTDWKDNLITTLSGGMKHRASLICTMVHDPELLLLDEPTVGVDPLLRDSFWDHFYGLSKQGKTILITTHYMDEARKCDRVGFMRRGKLIAEGKPKEILDRTGTDNLEDAFLVITKEGEK